MKKSNYIVLLGLLTLCLGLAGCADKEQSEENIMANENMKFYNIRKSYVDQLLNSVNETIMSAITGEDPSNCTHDCSTCSGCK